MATNIQFQQTDTAPGCASSAACSGATVGTVAECAASEGGTAGTAGDSFGASANSTNNACIFFEIDPDDTYYWCKGNYVVRLNVTSANANITWVATYVCRVNSSCTNQETIGSLTGQSIGLGSTGVQSMTVPGAATKPSAGDKIYIVCVFDMAGSHGNETAQITHNQLIDTPLASGVCIWNYHEAKADPATSAATPSITADADMLLVAFMATGDVSDGPGTPPITGLAGTWNALTASPVFDSGASGTMSKQWAWVGSGTQSTGAVTFAIDNSDSLVGLVLQIAGADLSSLPGSAYHNDEGVASGTNTTYDDSISADADDLIIAAISTGRRGVTVVDSPFSKIDLDNQATVRNGLTSGHASIMITYYQPTATQAQAYGGDYSGTNYDAYQALAIIPASTGTNVDPSALSVSPTINAPTIDPALDASALSVAPTINAPTIDPALDAGELANTISVNDAVIGLYADPDALAVPPTVNAPTIDPALDAGALSIAPSVNDPVVESGVSIDAGALSIAPSINAPAIDPALDAGALDQAPSINAPTIDPALDAGALSVAPSVNEPVVEVGLFVDPGALDQAPSINAPTIDPSLDAGALSIAPSVNDVEIAVGTNIDVGALDQAPTINAPTIDPSLDVGSLDQAPTINAPTIDPSLDVGQLDQSITVEAPTIGTYIDPDPLALSTAVESPTIGIYADPSPLSLGTVNDPLISIVIDATQLSVPISVNDVSILTGLAGMQEAGVLTLTERELTYSVTSRLFSMTATQRLLALTATGDTMNWRIGEFGSDLELQLFDTGGAVYDLTGSETVTIQFTKPDDATIVSVAATIVDSAQGKIKWTITEDFWDQVGSWLVTVHVTWGNPATKIDKFPGTGADPVYVTIDES